MTQRKISLIASLAFLGGALALLSGCSWENQPAAEKKPEASLPLDRLKTEPAPAAETPAPKPAANPTPKPAMTKQQYSEAPAMTIDASKAYTATLETDKGTIEIELDAKATPVTVNNFVFLAREKFYDGTVFHRTIPGFMIQGGDPMGTGMGGPGYRFDDEPFDGAYERGVVAMANAGPDTNGSQFFIMHADYALPKNYVIFGKVTKGLEAVDAIATGPTQSGGEGSKPVTPVMVKTVTILEQ